MYFSSFDNNSYIRYWELRAVYRRKIKVKEKKEKSLSSPSRRIRIGTYIGNIICRPGGIKFPFSLYIDERIPDLSTKSHYTRKQDIIYGFFVEKRPPKALLAFIGI